MTLTAADLMADFSVTPGTDAALAERKETDAKAAADLDAYFMGDAPSYEPEEPFSAVGGDGFAKPEHFSNAVLATVEAISYCTVLELVIPGYWDMAWNERPSYEEETKAIDAWCEANDAHFFSWEGCSFGSGAMTMVACANAAALGKSKVVIEALS